MDPTTKRRLREAKDTMDRDKLEDVLKHCEKERIFDTISQKCSTTLQMRGCFSSCNVAVEGRLSCKGNVLVTMFKLFKMLGPY